MLTYYCATDMPELEVINGNEKGGALSEISAIKDPSHLKVT
jgi:hypothetical protein